MILRLPNRIHLPNYNVKVKFVEDNNQKDQDDVTFGEMSTRNSTAVITDVNPVFNKYLYATFIIYSLANAYEINISKHKSHSLGIYIYHLLEFNHIMKIFDSFKTNQTFKSFQISVPSFKIKIQSADKMNGAFGLIVISERTIKIHQNCNAKIKKVVLMHELIEWSNIMYNIGMKHPEIQTLSEGLVYVLNKGRFVS